MGSTRCGSAQDFIRALKAPSDPPHPSGPLKIELAREAWDATAFFLPNKGEVIAEWLLTRLLKEKAKALDTSPILDTRYWQLLSDVLSSPDGENARLIGTARSIKSWLLPLLNRIPIAPVVVAFFSLLTHVQRDKAILSALVSRCLLVLWPLAVPKFSLETLLECLGSVFAYLAQAGSDGTNDIARSFWQFTLQIVSSYRSAFGNSANKRKVYATFLQNHLAYWLQYIVTEVGQDEHRAVFVSESYSAGVETLFNLDILRAMEDTKCDPALKDALLKALDASPREALKVLPRLLRSFTLSIKRHKSALFSQGSNQAAGIVARQVQGAGIAFFTLCDELLGLVNHREEVQIWKTRVSLLAIVQDENMYFLGDDHATYILRRSGEMAIEALQYAWQEKRIQQVDWGLEVLSSLTRIDYDLMSPALPTVWPRLTLIPDHSSSVFTYLSLLTDYHSKTRTINALIFHWLDALSIQTLQDGPDDLRSTYQSALSGPLLSFSFVGVLSKSIRGFLTPGQVTEVVQLVLQRFRDAFKQFRECDKKAAADNGTGARKKRKKDIAPMSPIETHVDPECAAVTFALIARATVIILNSLPLHSVLHDARQEIRLAVTEAHSSVVARGLKGAFKVIETMDRRDTWAWQIVATASLHVHYNISSSSNIKLDLRCEEATVTKMFAAIKSEGIVPELTVEIVRGLLNEAVNDVVEFQPVFEDALRYLERYLDVGKSSWSGKSHHLTIDGGNKQGATAVFHLLLTRWLSIFDTQASAEQLNRLARLMLGTLSVDPRKDRTVSATATMTTTLHNAEMWELRHLRDAFLARIQEQTAPLDDLNLQKPQAVPVDVLEVSATYETLLRAPGEYLSRSSRTELLRRALAADMSIRPLCQKDDWITSGGAHSLLVIREFLRRTISVAGSVDHPDADVFLNNLMMPLPSESSDIRSSDDLVAVTVDLISLYLSTFLKNATKGDEEVVVNAVEAFTMSLSIPTEQQTAPPVISERSLLRFIDLVTTNFESHQFTGRLSSQLRHLHERMVSIYSSRMLALVSKGPSRWGDHTITETNLLHAWSRCLALGRWLRIDGVDIPKFGRTLLGLLLANRQSFFPADVCSSLLDILLEELDVNVAKDQRTRLESLVAAYIAIIRVRGIQDFAALEGRLCGRMKLLTPASFAYILDYIFEALSCPVTLPTDDMASLIRLSSLLVHDAPEGTSKITQNQTTRCLNLFADESEFLAKFPLRREVLKLMSSQLNDRPASIRTSDVSSIWSILGDLLAESGEHDGTTDATVFHEIIAIVSALIRLRRDLVLNTLPHLGMILRQLTKCLRSLRPQLGAKQTKLVMNTLPGWISANKPLSAEESKALARLMTTLTTKTIMRTYGQSPDAQKPESLVRPFSKHAAYVLTAYIEAVNDPLCHVSMQVRKELQPGLFSLCDMLGEHNRDAMMVSALDAGGKVTMKTLWKEYEKQKYIGKG